MPADSVELSAQRNGPVLPVTETTQALLGSRAQVVGKSQFGYWTRIGMWFLACAGIVSAARGVGIENHETDQIAAQDGSVQVTEHIRMQPGAINRVSIVKQGRMAVVYGPPIGADDETSELGEVELALLTHHRRDVMWAAAPLDDSTAEVVAPQAESSLIESPTDFWTEFVTARFGDMSQQSTKVLARPFDIDRWVKDGDTCELGPLSFQVVATPGYTRGAVSYVIDIDGERVAFVGDLIYGDGQIFDLFSFQDAIPEAKIRGYHGYGSRLAELVESLQRIADLEPTILVPARGPVIADPQAAIARLIRRVRAVYGNYLSTNALHWYFKEERMRLCGQRILGEDANIELMPYSEHVDNPDWIWGLGTTRMIISKDGRGFLLDCWNENVIVTVQNMITNREISGIDGIFVTHHHDDHTAMVQAAAEAFDCDIYAEESYADILENPGAYHMPAVSPNAMRRVKRMRDGEQVKWREFDLTYHFFPGQTIYHGALLVEHPEEQPVFFVGDSFAPSGFDDYCVLNRNLLHDDQGYLLCLAKLRALEQPTWIVNQHIPYVFRFSDEELDYLESRYRHRIELLSELFPWDDPNYGVDEQWAVFYPYGQEVTQGEAGELEVRLTNHSDHDRSFDIVVHGPEPHSVQDATQTIRLAANETGTLRFSIRAPAETGVCLFTADIRSEGMDFKRWIEALMSVR